MMVGVDCYGEWVVVVAMKVAGGGDGNLLVSPTLEETPVLSDNDILTMDEAKHSDTTEENQDDFQEEHRCDEMIKTQPSPQIHSAFDVVDSVPHVPQDRWSRVRDSEAASAQECLFVNFLLENKSKKLIEALKEEGWVLAMTEELNQFERNHVWTLVPKPYGVSVNETQFRGKIGSLMYMTASKPDIQYSICLCARYQANPKESHLVVVKGIFWYLKAEAEYVVIASCCAQVRWIKSQLANYDVYYDKKSSISVALTKQPSSYYAKYLREFWYTAEADMQTKSITFTLSHLDKPLSFDLDTFSSIIRLKSNEPYVSMPQKETVKQGLATLGLFDEEKPAILSSDLIRACKECQTTKHLLHQISISYHGTSATKLLSKLSDEEVNVEESADKSLSETSMKQTPKPRAPTDILNEADKRAKANQLILKIPYDIELKIRVVKSFIKTNLLEQLSDSELSDMPDDVIYSVSEFENVDSNVKSGHEVSHSEYQEEDFHADESYAFCWSSSKVLADRTSFGAYSDHQCYQRSTAWSSFRETQSQLNKKKKLTNALQSKIGKLVESKFSSEMEDVRDALQTQSKHIQSYCQGFQTMQSQLLDITDLLQLAKQTEKPQGEQPEVAKGNEENSLIIHTSEEKKETERIILEDNSDDELDK
nr:hypothetical protein [Tanacetum cinerariifolium]